MNKPKITVYYLEKLPNLNVVSVQKNYGDIRTTQGSMARNGWQTLLQSVVIPEEEWENVTADNIRDYVK